LELAQNNILAVAGIEFIIITEKNAKCQLPINKFVPFSTDRRISWWI